MKNTYFGEIISLGLVVNYKSKKRNKAYTKKEKELILKEIQSIIKNNIDSLDIKIHQEEYIEGLFDESVISSPFKSKFLLDFMKDNFNKSELGFSYIFVKGIEKYTANPLNNSFLEIADKDKFSYYDEKINVLKSLIASQIDRYLIQDLASSYPQDIIINVPYFKKEFLYELPKNIKGFICRKLDRPDLILELSSAYEIPILMTGRSYPADSFCIIDGIHKKSYMNPREKRVSNLKALRDLYTFQLGEDPIYAAKDIKFYASLVDTRNLDRACSSTWYEGLALFKTEYMYITNWLNSNFKKYDLQGNLIEYFSISGVSRILDLAYDGQYFYGGKATDTLFVMDFENKVLIETIPLSFPVRAIAYNTQENVFYGNNWDQNYIYKFNLSGQILDSIQATEYGWTYGYAYDGWSKGGPYLWGFSQNNNLTEAILTQYSLATNEPTGFYLDLAYLAEDTVNIFAGGLFTHQGLIEGTVTIGGLLQNDVVFGLELDSILCEAPQNLETNVDGSDVTLTWEPPFEQSTLILGYNIYRNDTLINYTSIPETSFVDESLPFGTYSYYITALYEDDLENPSCESNPSNTVVVYINAPATILGGNVIADQDKMYLGHVNAYRLMDNEIMDMYTVDIIDTLGFYFILPIVYNDYYIHATPKSNSVYADEFAPTYYGNKLHWEDAITVFLANSIFDAGINMTQLISTGIGSGNLQGKISCQTKAIQSDQVADILVLLLNESSQCIDYKYSDQSGIFQFSDLPFGTYNILVESVGKTMSPATFILNGEEPSIEDMNFVISGDEIVMGLNELLPQYVNFVSDIFPNPVINNTNLEINTSKQTQVSAILINTRGKTIFDSQNQLITGSNKLTIDMKNLPSGAYYLRLTFENGHSITRKVFVMK